MKSAAAWKKRNGAQNWNARFILWKPATVMCAAGAPSGAERLCCNPIRYRQFPRAYLSIHKKLKW
jgi:hypothetical protein